MLLQLMATFRNSANFKCANILPIIFQQLNCIFLLAMKANYLFSYHSSISAAALYTQILFSSQSAIAEIIPSSVLFVSPETVLKYLLVLDVLISVTLHLEQHQKAECLKNDVLLLKEKKYKVLKVKGKALQNIRNHVW